MNHTNEPQGIILEYIDPLEKFKGWLVIDGGQQMMSAGGMRVQSGLSREHVMAMAHNMTMKMRICGLPIDGAKCGIDYPPSAPGKRAAMTRFLAAIRPYVEDRYSMGPDLNTTMDELEGIAHELGMPSVKMAIAKAQGMDMASFLARYAILSQAAIGGWSLSRMRAGFGVAVAALATLRALAIPALGVRVAVQGFGNLAKAAIIGLLEAGATIVAVADADKCLRAKPGQTLPLAEFLEHRGTLLPVTATTNSFEILNKEVIVSQDCDILILAAIEHAVTEANAGLVAAKGVVPGANLAITLGGDEALFARGVVALPSFVAGCGGSLSMKGLFAPEQPPSPRQVLDSIAEAMNSMVERILLKSRLQKITPTQAATLLCQGEGKVLGQKPYSPASA